MAKQKTPAKRKDPPVSRRQVFFRSEHFRSALDQYADELGLEFGDMYYYLDVEDDKADEMGVRV